VGDIIGGGGVLNRSQDSKGSPSLQAGVCSMS
jgi:hypothetical protein